MPVKKLKNILVLHGADKMFELVDKVEDYPHFLPWYSKTEVIGRSGNELKARLFMDYMRVRQSFATHNRNIPGRKSVWNCSKARSKPYVERGNLSIWATICAKSNSIWNTIFQCRFVRLNFPVFNHLSATLVEAFVKEADRRYA